MTLTLPAKLAVVEVDLDTTPPLVTITADPSVDAPVPWAVTLRSNEDIGTAELDVLDAAGELHSVGYEQTDARTLVLTIPTVAIAGPASLVGYVSDMACNKTPVDVGVQIIRTTPFDVTVLIGHALGVSASIGPAFDVESSIEHAEDVWKGIDHAFATEGTVHHAFDVEETIQ